MLRCIGIFVPFTVVACAAVYLAQTYRPGINAFYNTSRQNEPNMGIVNEKKWAKWLELPDVPNFHKVSDELYRGAQPTAEGMVKLQRLGIKTVVNLRFSRSDHDEVVQAGLNYEEINMTTWNPEIKDVIRFLKIVTDSNNTPIFVHCRRGADRTGLMCAIYRIAVEGWSKTEAIEEMTKGGFGFFRSWQNLVDYILKLDVDEIKRNAGLNE